MPGSNFEIETDANLRLDDRAPSIDWASVPQGDGLGEQSPRTFGEASISVSAIFPDPTVCQSFGSAYLKCPSSDSFTSALKDFVPPVAVNISNCGSVKILKTDDEGTPLAGAEFTLYTDNAPVGGSRGAEDTVTTLKCTTTLPEGSCTISNVLQGEYWVVETVVPPGDDPVATEPHVTVVADATVTVGPLVDPRQRGGILVTKTRKHVADGPGNHPHAGVEFTVDGATETTDASGQACFDNLLFGDYTVHETTPAGYLGEADKTVTVDNSATCAEDPYVGETVSFHNSPLSNITVSFSSQVTGGTAAQISCTGHTATRPTRRPPPSTTTRRRSRISCPAPTPARL